jgi:hypothetical protein
MGGHIGPPCKNCPMSANRYKLGRADLRARHHCGQVGRRAHPASAVGKLALGLILAVLLTGGAGAGEAFEMPRPGRVWSFPQDHGSHPEFKTEWWYYVGHLKAASGESFGYQLTFFRVALRKPDPQAGRPGRFTTSFSPTWPSRTRPAAPLPFGTRPAGGPWVCPGRLRTP